MTTITASNLSHSAIRQYAELVGEHHKIYSPEGLADLDLLLSELQMAVRYEDSDDKFLNEASVVDDDQHMTIFLPTMTSTLRDRFTIAHEVAHFFLHYLNVNAQGRIKFGRGGSSPAETQANIFASSLLMPEKQFRNAHSECSGDIGALARRFGVSRAAARVRSSVLGLV